MNENSHKTYYYYYMRKQFLPEHPERSAATRCFSACHSAYNSYFSLSQRRSLIYGYALGEAVDQRKPTMN